MNMKKYTLLTLTLFLLATATFGQQRTVEKNFNVINSQKLNLDLKFGKNITINSWDKKEVAFKATIEINQGKLNKALELDFDEQNNMLTIAADFNKQLLKTGRAEDCSDSDNHTLSWSNDSEQVRVCSNINYELFVPTNIDLTVETISGDIKLVNLAGPIHAKSISGFVDLSWPSNRPARFNLKTISGEAFTNIEELSFSNKKKNIPLVGYKIEAAINGGGPTVSLESISGNIYLRKEQG